MPFIIFNDKNKTPKFIEKLAKILPYAIMGMLVIYCLKDVTFKNINSFFPSLISCIIVSVLYIWKRNTLLSIIIGTICYMLLVQFVF